MNNVPWGDIAFYVFIITLVVLCAGDPDIIDGIVYRLMH